MPDLEGTAGLDITEALSSVDALAEQTMAALDAAFSSAVESFTSQFSTAADEIQGRLEEALSDLPVTADTTAAEAEVAGLATEQTVPIGADTAPAEGELTSLVTEVESTEATIVVEADTSGAEAAVSDLAESTDDLGVSTREASSGVGGLGQASGLLAGGAALARGEVGGLESAAGALGGRVGLAAAGLGTLAVTAGLFFNEAVDALGATQRFEATLGDMANRVENLRDIEGLNTNLSELAITLGSDDDKVRQVSARLFELSSASGKADDASALFVQRMVALGARAVALNPQLGDIGDVTDRLSTALVRGGRFAASFGLDLNQAQINARALQDTNKRTSEELSFVEKAMAGAALATEKYGGDLEELIARGSQNAITQQRTFRQVIVETAEEIGKPLVAPIFQLFKDSQPAVRALGESIGELAQSAIPLLDGGLRAAVPILQVVSSLVSGLTELTDGLGITSTAAGAALGFAFGGVPGLIIGGLGGLIADLGLLGETEKTIEQRTSELSASLREVSAAVAVERFQRYSVAVQEAERSTRLGNTVVRSAVEAQALLNRGLDEGVRARQREAALTGESADALRAFTRLARDDIGAAQLVIDGLRQKGIDTARYQVALRQAAGTQREAIAVDNLAREATVLLTGSYEDQIKILSEKDDALLATYDATFRAFHADEQARDAVDKLNTAYAESIKAGNDNAKALDDQSRALTSAEEAILHAAAATGAKAAEDHKAEGAVAAHQASIDAQIGELHKFTDTLEPGSPLRTFLEEYIRKLTVEIPKEVHTDVTVSAADALLALEDVQRALIGIGVPVDIEPRVNHAAAGGTFTESFVGEQGMEYVKANPGGTFTVYPNLQARSLSSSATPVTLNVDVRMDPRGVATVTVSDTSGNTLAVKRQQIRADVRAL